MRKITAYVYWKSTHELEVPDDFDGDLFSLDEYQLDEINSQICEIYDWDIR